MARKLAFKIIITIAVLIILVSIAVFSMILPRAGQEHPTSSKVSLKSAEKTSAMGGVDNCELTVVVDNYPDGGLETAWGVSILARTSSATILFDTGPDPGVLERNMKRLGIDPGEIDFVVVSHEHLDHVGGLSYLAKVRPGIKVYVPRDMHGGAKNGLEKMGFKVIEVGNTSIIADGIAIIGQLRGPPMEQALAINVKGLGLVTLVGCSHPGVVKIVEKAVNDLGIKPYLVLGGFHKSGAPPSECERIIRGLIGLGIRKIAPIHCSGDAIRSMLEKNYPEYYLKCYVGCGVSLP